MSERMEHMEVEGEGGRDKGGKRENFLVGGRGNKGMVLEGGKGERERFDGWFSRQRHGEGEKYQWLDRERKKGKEFGGIEKGVREAIGGESEGGSE